MFVSMICTPLAERSERVGEESLVAFAVFLLENFVGRGEGQINGSTKSQKVFFHDWFDLGSPSLFP